MNPPGLHSAPHYAATFFVQVEARKRAAADPQKMGNIDLTKPHDPTRFVRDRHNYVVSIVGAFWKKEKKRERAEKAASQEKSTGHGAKNKTLVTLGEERDKQIEHLQHELNKKLNMLASRSEELRQEGKTASGNGNSDRVQMILSERNS